MRFLVWCGGSGYRSLQAQEIILMKGAFTRLASVFSLFFSSLALAASPAFDRDIAITSAMNLDGVWSLTVKDFSRNKTATFDASKSQTKIGLKLLDFNSETCVALFDSFRGKLLVTLASPSLSPEISSSELSYSEASEEILAAIDGKVTKKYRASLWRRIPKN